MSGGGRRPSGPPPCAAATPAGLPPCPACGGPVFPEGASERQPIRCGGCGAAYRHPTMALVLSLVLPGLGSIYQRRVAWGVILVAAGSAAFAATMWRLVGHVVAAWRGEPATVTRILAESAAGIAAVLLAYGVDLLAVWLRRRHLVAAGRRPGRRRTA